MARYRNEEELSLEGVLKALLLLLTLKKTTISIVLSSNTGANRSRSNSSSSSDNGTSELVLGSMLSTLADLVSQNTVLSSTISSLIDNTSS